MNNNKVWVHDKAVNLARRYSVQNENDLLQVCELNKFVIDEKGKKVSFSDASKLNP